MPQVQLLGRSRRPARCSYCHDDSEAVERCCPGCGTWTHADCHHELGRCPTVGCTGRTPRVDEDSTWSDVYAALARLRTRRPLGDARPVPDPSHDAPLLQWAARAEPPAGAWLSRMGRYASLAIQGAVYLTVWTALVYALAAPQLAQRPGVYGFLWEGFLSRPAFYLLVGALPAAILIGALLAGVRASCRLVGSCLALPSLSRSQPIPARLRLGSRMPSGRVQLHLTPVEGGPPIPHPLRRVWVQASQLPGWTARPQAVLLYTAPTAPSRILLESLRGSLAFVRVELA